MYEPFLLMPVGVKHVVTQRFGEAKQDYSTYGLIRHNGIDIAAALGSPLFASHEGQVLRYFDTGYGNTVEIWFPKVSKDAVFKTIYAHMSDFDVANYAWVKAGQVLGSMGSTGNSTGPHVHWGLKFIGGTNWGYRDWIDPRPHIIGGLK